MSNADQHETSGLATEGAQQPVGEKLNTYAVVSAPGKATPDEVYPFRATVEPAQQELQTQPQKSGSSLVATAALFVAVIACAVGLAFVIPMLLKPRAPALYIDLGNQRFDPAGLGGRLIARWENNATYQLTIDPLEPQQLDGFRAVASDPPHPLSIVIRVKNGAGLVACQKEILLPAPQSAADSGHAKVLLPGTTSAGDNVQYVSGPDGKIAEIALDGALPCPADVYRSFVAWDFTSNFPTLAGQTEWLKHAKALAEAQKPHANQWTGVVQHLPAPIEGDDVITGDNPTRGTVDTSAGRSFLIIKNGTGPRPSEWQFFPAAIHFRCEKTGVCVLSRANTRTTLQARLLK